MTIEKLKALALAADSKAAWSLHPRAATSVIGSDGYVVAACGGYSSNQLDAEELYRRLHANALYIAAANPAYILKLLDEVEKAQAVQERLGKYVALPTRLMDLSEALRTSLAAIKDGGQQC